MNPIDTTVVPSELDPATEADHWREDFAQPPATYRPVPFWSWNERIEPHEVHRQAKLIADAGWGGGFIHSRIGLLTPYLGEEWFHAADAALEACRENGLKVWLYDEDKWPSGFSGGSVPLADEAFRTKSLFARPVGKTTPYETEPVGQPQEGLQVYRWVSPLGYDWFNGTCYGDTMSREAMRRFLDDAYETYHARYSKDYGTLVMAEFTDEPCAVYRGRIPHGSVPFTDELFDRFTAMHGYDAREKLYLLFTDAPGAARFRLHYFRTVNDLFENNFTKQLGDWCDAHGISLTGHYLLEGQLYEQQLWGVKIMPNYRHQGVPGVDLLCRQIEERITAKQCQSVVNQYAKPRMLSELYGVAGAGLSFEDRLWMGAQQMALGVNVLNHHLCLYTMAGCRKRDYPQNMFYPQPWWPLNRVIDDALSRVCVALSQGRYHAEALLLHPQESTFVLWHSKTDVHDEELPSSHQNMDWEPVVPGVRDRVAQLDAKLQAILNALLGAQRTFDLGDETILADVSEIVGERENARFIVGVMEYQCVIVPPMETLAQTTFDLLRNFVQSGGSVLLCGDPPPLLDGETSSEMNEWFASVPRVETENIAAELAQAVAPAVEAVDLSKEDARLLFVHTRDLEGAATWSPEVNGASTRTENGNGKSAHEAQRLVFLTNLHRVRGFSSALRFRGAWQSVRALDMRDGSVKELAASREDDALCVQLSFAPTQCHLLLLSNDAPEGTVESTRVEGGTQLVEIPAAAWNVERLDDNAITLDYAAWRCGNDDWSERPMPLVSLQRHLNTQRFNGELALRYTVRVDGMNPARKVHLVVEHPEWFSTFVNGKQVEYAGLPFWRDIRWMPIDISGLLQDGENTFELHYPQFLPGDLTSIHDQDARYGTEIEAIYLVGDFGVTGQATGEKSVEPHWQKWELPPISVQCFAENSFALTEPQPLRMGDTTTQGLPFYAGRLRFTADLQEALRECSRGGMLKIGVERLDGAVGEVAVDERVIGHFVSHPLEVELDEQALDGREISLTWYGTLRNLMGPHHHVNGELCLVGPLEFEAAAQGSDYSQWFESWTRGEASSDTWRERYCMIAFGDIGSVRIIG